MRDSGRHLRRFAALAASAAELIVLGGVAAEQTARGPETAPGENWVQLWETRRCQACGTEGEFWAIFEPDTAETHRFMTMCLTCGAINGDLPAADERHWKNIYRTEPHGFTAATTPPTSETEGRAVYTCERCGYRYEETLPRLEPEPTSEPEPTTVPRDVRTPAPAATPEPMPEPSPEPAPLAPYVFGVGGGLFQPDRPVTRAEAAAMLARLLSQAREEAIPRGTEVFRDVAPAAWYFDALSYLAGNGVLLGRGGGLFDPAAPVTWPELRAMTGRYLAACGVEAPAWEDTPGVGPVTRAEAAAALGRAAGRTPRREWIDSRPAGLNTFEDVPPDCRYFYEIVTAANPYQR